jgi:hypothetical protein
MESIPVQSTRSTRAHPFLPQSLPLNMDSLFIKLEGNRPDYAEEKFIILFASGTNRTSHYDILQSSKGTGGSRYVFTANELPRIARKYWRITKRTQRQSHDYLWNDEMDFIPDESPPSPPDSPLWCPPSRLMSLLKDDPLLSPLSNTYSATISFPTVTRELLPWKHAFNEVFKKIDRVVFANQIVPSTVFTLSHALETHFQKPTANETLKQIDQGICELMKGIWVCWESLTTDAHRKKSGKKGARIFQSHIEYFVLNESLRCLVNVRDSLMFFVHMIASNVSHYNRKPESIELILHYLGFFANPSFVSIYRWIYGNKGHPQPELCGPVHAHEAKRQYESTFLIILDRVKKSRNNSSHPSAPNQKSTAAELLLALAMLSGISNNNHQAFSDLKYNKTRWYD